MSSIFTSILGKDDIAREICRIYQTGHHSHPEDISYYFQCVDGKPTVCLRCKVPLLFSDGCLTCMENPAGKYII